MNTSEVFANIRKDTIKITPEMYTKFQTLVSSAPLSLPIFHYAAYENSPNTLKQLIEFKANSQLQSTCTIVFAKNSTPLMFAFAKSSDKCIASLISQAGQADSNGLTASFICLLNFKNQLCQQFFMNQKYLSKEISLVQQGKYSHMQLIIYYGLMKQFEWIVDNFTSFGQDLQRDFYVQIAMIGKTHALDTIQQSEHIKNKKQKLYFSENTYVLLKKGLKFLETNYIEAVANKWDKKTYQTDFGSLSFTDRVPKFDPEEEKRKLHEIYRQDLKKHLVLSKQQSKELILQKQTLLNTYFSQNLTLQLIEQNPLLRRVASQIGLFASHYAILLDDTTLLSQTLKNDYYFTISQPYETVPIGANFLEFALRLNKVETSKFILDCSEEYSQLKTADGKSFFNLAKELRNEASAAVFACSGIILQELANSTYEDNLIFTACSEQNLEVLEGLECLFYKISCQNEFLRVFDLFAQRIIDQSVLVDNVYKSVLDFIGWYIVNNMLDGGEWDAVLASISKCFKVDSETYINDRLVEWQNYQKLLERQQQINGSYLVEKPFIEKKLQEVVEKQKSIKYKYVFSKLYQLVQIFDHTDKSVYDSKLLLCKNYLPFAKDWQFVEFITQLQAKKNLEQKIPVRADTRESNFEDKIYNGFQPIHYALIYGDLNFIKKNIKLFYYIDNSSTVILPFPNLSPNSSIVVAKNTSLFVILLLSQSTQFVYQLLSPIIEDILSKSYLDLNPKLKQFLFLLLQNTENFNLIDFILLLPQDKYLNHMYMMLLKLYVKFFDKFQVNIDRLISYSYIIQNYSYIQKFSTILPLIAKDQFVLHKQTVCFFIQLKSVLQAGKVNLQTVKYLDKVIQFFGVASIINKYKDEKSMTPEIRKQCIDLIQYQYDPFYYRFQKDELFVTYKDMDDNDSQHLNSVIQELHFTEFLDQIYLGSVSNLALFAQYKDQVDFRVSNYKNIYNGFSPFYYAVFFKKMRYIQYCIDNNLVLEPSSRQIKINYNNQFIIFNKYQCHPLGLSVCSGDKECFQVLYEYYQKIAGNQILLFKEQQYFLRLGLIYQFPDITKSSFFLSEIKETSIMIYDHPGFYTFLHDMFIVNNVELINFMISNINTSSSLLVHIQKGLIHRVNGQTPLDYIEDQNFSKYFKFFLLANICIDNIQNQSIEDDLQLLNNYYFQDEEVKQASLSKQQQGLFEIKQDFTSTQTIVIQNKFEQWVNMFYQHDTEKQLSMYRSDQEILESRQSNYLFGCYKGFNQLLYGALNNNQIITQYFMKTQSATTIKDETVILYNGRQITLPEGSTVFHLVVLTKDQQFVNIIQEYFIEEWFQLTLVDAEKQIIIKQDKFINLMPPYQLTITEIASRNNICVSLLLVFCEVLRLIRQQQDSILYIIMNNCILSKNFGLLSKILLVLNQYNNQIVLTFFSMKQKYFKIDEWNYDFQQIINIQKYLDKDNHNQVFIEKMIKYNIAKLNYQLIQENNLFQTTNIHQYYQLKSPYLEQFYDLQFNNHLNQNAIKQLRKDFDFSKFQIPVTSEQKLLLSENTTNVDFSSQVELQTVWFTQLAENVKKHHIKYFLNQFDTRKTDISLQTYYGFYSIHYSILYQNFENFIKFVEYESQCKTQVDQIILFNKQYIFIPKNTNAIQLIVILKLDKFLEVISKQTFNILVQDGEDLEYINKICIIQHVITGLFLIDLNQEILNNLIQLSIKNQNIRFFELLIQKSSKESIKKLLKEDSIVGDYKFLLQQQ